MAYVDCCKAWFRVRCRSVCRKAQRLSVSEKPAATAALRALLACATCNMQRATCSVQHTMCNMQHATCNVQHTMCNIQHATCNTQYATWSVARSADRSSHCTAITIAIACSAALHGPELPCYHCMQPLHAMPQFDAPMKQQAAMGPDGVGAPIEASLEEQHFECAVARWLQMGKAARRRYGAQQVACRAEPSRE